MRTFYVLLGYPDYLANEFGSDTWLSGKIKAETPGEALEAARALLRTESEEEGEGFTKEEAEDFAPLLIIETPHPIQFH